MACKPGSVSQRTKARQPMIIHLGRPSLNASCNQPGRRSENRPDSENTVCHPYLVLLPVGFTVPTLLPAWRCALTAPFHPYLHRSAGGLLSVALSLGSPPPGVTRHRVSVEPGLSSAPAWRKQRSSGHLTCLRDTLPLATCRDRMRIDTFVRTQTSSGLSVFPTEQTLPCACLPLTNPPLCWHTKHLQGNAR